MGKKTPLFSEHERLGARIVDFGGWNMPLQYTSVIDEHAACRTQAALFDASHMGEFEVSGKDALRFLNESLTNDLSKTVPGQAQYNLMCKENGGILDDLVVYRLADDRFLVVANASNAEKDFLHLKGLSESYDVELTDRSSDYALIALQGPKAAEMLSATCPASLADIGTYRFLESTVAGASGIVARTGYTGEDGFELYVSPKDAPTVWQALEKAGAKPAGLAARDTLRMEMKFALYGNELTEEINPIEASLKWVVKLKKEKFVGKAAIESANPSRKLVGMRVLDRGIARKDCKVFSSNGEEIGILTSGTQSPTLKIPIAIGFVALEHSKVGTPLSVDVRGKKLKAEVVKTPFYERAN